MIIDDFSNPKRKLTVSEASAANDYFTRRKSEEDRIAGVKAPAKNKKNPANTDYAKKRKQQDIEESRPFRGTGGAFNRGDDERHDLDPTDWYKVKDGKMFRVSIYPRQVKQAEREGYSRTQAEAKAAAGSQGVAEGSLEEVSQDTSRSYAQKARASQKDLINQTHRKGADTDALNKKIKNRQQGMDRAHTDKRYYKGDKGVAEGSVDHRALGKHHEEMTDQELRKVGSKLPDGWDAAVFRRKLASHPKYAQALKHYDKSEYHFGKAARQGVAEGLVKDIKRLATGKDVKSRAGQEIAKSQDASMKGDNKTSKKHFDRYDKLDKLANKKHGVAEGLNENAEDLHIGDPVIITGNGIEFEGATGEIIDFGQQHRFVVVDLYNHGRHSFHSSDVSFNEYAGSNDEEARMYDAGEFGDDDRDDMNESLMNKLQQALLKEGRVKELADDLKTLNDTEFMKKYSKAKAAIRKDMKKLHEAVSTLSPEQLAYNQLRAQIDSANFLRGDNTANTVVNTTPEVQASQANMNNKLAQMAAALKAKGIDAAAEYDAPEPGAAPAQPVDLNQKYNSKNKVQQPVAAAPVPPAQPGVAEARTSAAQRLSTAWDRQRAKSNASLARTPGSIPKKQEPKKADPVPKTVSEHRAKRQALMAQMLNGH